MMSEEFEAKSLRSLRSIGETVADENTEKYPSDFEDLLPYVCRKFNCEFDIFVKKEYLKDECYHYKKSNVPVKYKRSLTIGQPLNLDPSPPKQQSVAAAIDSQSTSITDDPTSFTISAVYDSRNLLTEVFMYRIPHVPRMVLQVIALLIPIYKHLTKITIRSSGIDGAIIYELNKILALKSLSDICLDDNFLSEQNYAILLEKSSFLRNLSLARCRIGDKICQTIVSKLHYQAPAEKSLLLLNLSGNYITDEGAKYIASMLRSNRHLKYLNLASNRITDDGALAVLNVLMEFPLTYDEIAEKRRRLLEHLKHKKALIAKFLAELSSGNHDQCYANVTGRKKTMNFVPPGIDESDKRYNQVKAEMITEQVMDDLHDPFGKARCVTWYGWSYCTGNMTLSILNLSYNDLSFITIKKVLRVLQYQDKAKGTASGLLKIDIEGNNLPEQCSEYAAISIIINQRLGGNKDEKTEKTRRKSRVRLSSFSSKSISMHI